MKTRPCFLHRLGLALVLFASTAAATRLHAQMLQNGSFESPALANGGSSDYPATGWTITGIAAVVTNGAGLGTTPYGNQYADLTNGLNSTESQTITGAFTLNQVYYLTVSASMYNATTGLLTLAVSGGASASQTFTLPARGIPSNTPLPFMTYSLAFTPTTATAVTVTLTSGTGGAIATDVLLDNVQIVPEPATWAALLAGAGLGGIALLRRRAAARA